MGNKRNSAIQQKKPQPKKNRKARIAVIVTLSVVLVALITLGVVLIARNVSEHSKNKKVVALCNGFEIPYEELRFLTMLYKGEMENEYGEGIWDDPATAEQYRAELEERVWSSLPTNYLVLSACRQLGISTQSKEINNYVKQTVKETKDVLASESIKYEDFLKEKYMSESLYRFQLSITYLFDVVDYTLIDNGIYAYTMKNIGDFIDHVMKDDEYVRTIQVYVQGTEGESIESRLERGKTISEHLRSIDDYEQRLEAMSGYIGSVENGDFVDVSGNGFYFLRGLQDQAYEDVAFSLKIGEVSEAFESNGAVFVLMRLPLEEDYVSLHCAELLEDWQNVKYELYMNQFRESCTIDLTEYGKSIDLVAMK